MPSPPRAVEALMALMGRTRRWGRTTEDADLSLGVLRAIPSLDRAWERAQASLASAPELLLELGRYPPTQGAEELLEAIDALWVREGGRSHDPFSFVLCNGALDGGAHALAGLPRDSEVLYASPGFDFGLAIGRCGLTPRRIELAVDFAAVDLVDAIAWHLRTRGAPSAVIVSFPTNPGGRSGGPEEWAGLVRMTADVGARLIVDDVYRCVDRPRDLEVLEADHVLVVDSLTKRAGAPGLRLGWVRCPRTLVDLVRGSVACSNVGVASPVVRLAIAFLGEYLDDPSIAEEVLQEVDRRRRALRALAREWPETGLTVPEVGIFAWAPLHAPDDCEQVSQRLSDAGIRATIVRAEAGGVRAVLRFCFTATGDAERVVALAMEAVGDCLGAEVLAGRPRSARS